MKVRPGAVWLPLFLLLMSFPLTGQTVPSSVAERYKATADKIIAAALSDTEGYKDLTYLSDHIGNRVNGSESIKQAVAWAIQTMKKDGLSNVSTHPVTVPRWIRGREEARILAPVEQQLHLLGLGSSVPTPPEGITAGIVAVSSWDELKSIGADRIKGKIVVFNPGWKGYGVGSQYRTQAASRAAQFGAVAALVRSATGLSLQDPHTGAQFYDKDTTKIPAAALSVEDAALLARLYSEGAEVKVKLTIDSHPVGTAVDANVVGELPGSEHPEQVVVIGGHIDSWDVGQGAQDDGTGIIATLEAVAILKKLGLQPRRTIRVVFWTDEESGASGAKAYWQWIGDGVKNHVAAIEMDTGAEAPVGIGYGSRFSAAQTTDGPKPDPASLALLNQIAALLEPVGSNHILQGGGGTDVKPLTDDGVPGLRPVNTGTHYFDWHHSEADTIDKVDLNDFRKNIATLAVLSYILADTPEVLAGGGI